MPPSLLPKIKAATFVSYFDNDRVRGKLNGEDKKQKAFHFNRHWKCKVIVVERIWKDAYDMASIPKQSKGKRKYNPFLEKGDTGKGREKKYCQRRELGKRGDVPMRRSGGNALNQKTEEILRSWTPRAISQVFHGLSPSTSSSQNTEK